MTYETDYLRYSIGVMPKFWRTYRLKCAADEKSMISAI